MSDHKVRQRVTRRVIGEIVGWSVEDWAEGIPLALPPSATLPINAPLDLQRGQPLLEALRAFLRDHSGDFMPIDATKFSAGTILRITLRKVLEEDERLGTEGVTQDVQLASLPSLREIVCET
jgi:hypothetical protein